MIKTGTKVKIINIEDKESAEHLELFINKTGEVLTYLYLTEEDKLNDNKRCKVLIDDTKETYYFKSKELIEIE